MDKADRGDLLLKIRSGDEKFLRNLYEEHRDAFITWVSRYYKCPDDLAADVYQQSFTTLFFNVKEGKLVKLNSSLKTYLFAIGKNLLRDHFKVAKRRQELLEVALESGELDYDIMQQYEQSEMKAIVVRLLEQIGEPCRTVLELFYLKNFAMEAIAHRMQYKSEQIAAKRKHICLRQMRSLLADAQTNGIS